jgi:hypothetical protein
VGGGEAVADVGAILPGVGLDTDACMQAFVEEPRLLKADKDAKYATQLSL